LSIGVEAVAITATQDIPHSVNDIAISTICLAAKINSLNQTMNLGIFIKNITGFYIYKSGTFLDHINFYWYVNFGISF